MTPKELLNRMSYDNEIQKQEAQKYIALKGIAQYQRVISYCCEQNIKPTYMQVSSLYRYDKRLRNSLYIYLATVEEYLRACLGNQFEDNEDGLIKTQVFISKQKIYKSVSFTLEQLPLGHLIEIVLVNQSIFKDVFDLNNLKINLDAIRVLRNKVSHHNFLFAETYSECVVNGEVGKSLELNIKNLQSFLPVDFRQGFAKMINNCADNLSVMQKIIC